MSVKEWKKVLDLNITDPLYRSIQGEGEDKPYEDIFMFLITADSKAVFLSIAG